MGLQAQKKIFAFASSPDFLSKMARAALREFEAGKTR
jgi:hypothetical protein